MPNLIPIEKVNAIQLFTVDGIDGLLQKIQDEVSTFEANTSTAKGRKEIASVAFKVAQSKVVIDTAGKNLVADWKTKAKVVDESRKKARDFLDNLRDEVRAPLSVWEQEQERIEAAKRLAEQIARDYDDAVAMNNLFDREREVIVREGDLKRQEDEAKAKREAEEAAAQASREAQERVKAEAEHKMRLRAEAEAKAKQEAAEAIERERVRAAKAEQDAKDAAARAEQAQKEAVERERVRVQAENDAKEQARLRQEREKQLQEQKRQADAENRRTVNTAALNALISNGIESSIAKECISVVAHGLIPGMEMVY